MSDLDDDVEQMRVQLGLKPWDEHARDAAEMVRKVGSDVGRRSGRTMRGILRAIAQCKRDGARLLTIDAEPWANLDYCVHMARDVVARLGMDITVKPDKMGVALGRGLAVLYTDHHVPRR